MKRIYYIFSSGTLKRKNNTIAFIPSGEIPPFEDENLAEENLIEPKSNNEKISSKDLKFIPVKDIESIIILGDVNFNKKFLELIGNNRIPLHIFNFYGNYRGSFYPPAEFASGAFLVKQVKFYTYFPRRYYLATKFVEGAALNIIKNLKRYQKKFIEIENIINQIYDMIKNLDQLKNYNKLLSIEANIHKLYYSTFNIIINSEIKFTSRKYNPPPDPINAIISFTNALVYSLITSEIYRTRLNPFISFLHEPGDQKFSLVYDLAEVFKPLLADRVIFSALNKKIIKLDDFEYKQNACYLNEIGRKKIVELFENKINKTIIHKSLKREVSYRRLVRLECYKLINHIQKKEIYKPFIIWW